MNPTFRSGTVKDAIACGQICYEAFKAIAEQHNFPPDLPSPDVAVGFLSMMLARSDVYSVIAELDGQVVGSNFLSEGDTIAGLGPITVVPTTQNAGIGRRLMKSVLDRAEARRQVGVRLVQVAYHNGSLSLYSKLGFQAREPFSRPSRVRPSSWHYPHTKCARRSGTILKCAMSCAGMCMDMTGTARLRMPLRMGPPRSLSTMVELLAMPPTLATLAMRLDGQTRISRR